jgi:hypothetical protein
MDSTLSMYKRLKKQRFIIGIAKLNNNNLKGE